MGKGLSKSSSNKIIDEDKQEVATVKENKWAACPKDKLEFKLFSIPAMNSHILIMVITKYIYCIFVLFSWYQEVVHKGAAVWGVDIKKIEM